MAGESLERNSLIQINKGKEKRSCSGTMKSEIKQSPNIRHKDPIKKIHVFNKK